MYCSKCGKYNSEEANYCISCGNQLSSDPPEDPKDESDIADENYLENKRKSPIRALILSFIFTGLGQVYNGQKSTAIAVLSLLVVGWVVCDFINYVLGIFFILCVGIGALFHAYSNAKLINSGKLPYVETNIKEMIAYIVACLFLSILISLISY